ncbi:nickel-responsive transcriptional regulator NikR [Aquirhabdus sp.]|uniref:nickel-responsive transcriptional regulator NikR n=1 Tax=Aquirhabdus sp. TaxID=2824160 RepID=UPI00396CE5CD
MNTTLPPQTIPNKTTEKPTNQSVSRISLSLSQELLTELDDMVESRGFDSRSQAVADMLHQHITEHKRNLGNDVMVGTITLLYDRSIPNLQHQLADLQYHHLAEVISSLHVQLTDNRVMEVILVQGPAKQLEIISDELITLRGVITGKLQLMTAVMPPVYA